MFAALLGTIVGQIIHAVNDSHGQDAAQVVADTVKSELAAIPAAAEEVHRVIDGHPALSD